MAEESGGVGVRAAARSSDGVIVLTLISLAVFVTPGLGDGDAEAGGWILALWVGLYVYFVAFDVLRGATPAQRLLGLRVTGGPSGSAPTLRQAAVRNAFLLLPQVAKPTHGRLRGAPIRCRDWRSCLPRRPASTPSTGRAVRPAGSVMPDSPPARLPWPHRWSPVGRGPAGTVRHWCVRKP